MRRRVFAPDPSDSDSDFEFKTPSNAAKRLLAVIRRIEQIPCESSESDPTQFDSPNSSQLFEPAPANDRLRCNLEIAHDNIMKELCHIKRYVDALDEEYDYLKFEYRLDL
jgi:hypothetical protein